MSSMSELIEQGTKHLTENWSDASTQTAIRDPGTLFYMLVNIAYLAKYGERGEYMLAVDSIYHELPNRFFKPLESGKAPTSTFSELTTEQRAAWA